jgi:CspA family cold shock protein
MQGTVKMFDPERGFGFITSDAGGPDIFVHANTLRREGIDTLRQGMRVSFSTEVNPRDKRLRACEIALYAPAAVERAGTRVDSDVAWALRGRSAAAPCAGCADLESASEPPEGHAPD